MAMPDTPSWTADLVRALPDDGNRYELVDGALIVTPAPSVAHQRAVSALVAGLVPYLQTQGVGYLFLPRMELSFGGDEVLEPDLCVAPREAALRARRWADLTGLLLVVEVLSPTTRPSLRAGKRRRYQRAGVAEYWGVDLERRAVERWRPGSPAAEVCVERLAWWPDGARVALELNLQALFDEALGQPA